MKYKASTTILGIFIAGMVQTASAEFIVIQEAVAKDPTSNYRVIDQQPEARSQGIGDLSADHLQLISDVERLRSENMALRNQLFQREVGTSQTLKGNVTQRSNSYRVLPKGKFNISKKTILGLVKQINAHPGTVTITGFTDSTGTTAINQKVALQRAVSFSQILVRNGAKKSKLKQDVRLGDYIATNATPAGRAANRRVEVKFN